MNYELETKEVIFRRTLQNKLYELYPYSDISVYTSTLTNTVTLEMFFFWKGERIGLRHEVLLLAIEKYELNELIEISILNIQREITDRILREGQTMDEMLKRLKILYYTLREMRGRSYNSREYKWLLGTKVIQELKLRNRFTIVSEIEEPIYLFDIVVEIDYRNPNNVQLFEDITNKIYI